MLRRTRLFSAAFLALMAITSTLPLSPSPALAYPGPEKAVLAFYFPWYRDFDWTSGKMGDQPVSAYLSADQGTIRRQINEASASGIDGFISSWWGPGDPTDANFDTLLNLSVGQDFRSTIYFEIHSWQFGSQDKVVNALRYVADKYANRPTFFHYRGRPVLFFWDVKAVPTNPGQSPQDAWASIRSQVDPNRSMLWSAETTDLSYLSVFDGIHLFSAATWSDNLSSTDRSFRAKIDDYNAQNRTSKIWAAGVAPGYDDTHLGRPGSYAVPRRDGSYYQESFGAAIVSSPEWITISSYNEWFEGTQIEPSQSYGSKYLDLTKSLSATFKGIPQGYAHPALFYTWNRTDGPIAGFATSRTWIWGPGAFSTAREPYQEAAGGSRLVHYFDKSRMEINDFNSDQSSPWFVTNGLLVSEMVNGRIQVGDNAYQPSSPAQIPVAGDPDDQSGPTYATLGPLQGLPGREVGQTIQEAVNSSGRTWTDPALPATYAAFYVPETHHTVANVFWDFLNSTAPVYDNGPVSERLFDPVFYATGLPITDAYWTSAKVGGVPRDVLIQAFERRILTYTPSNPDGWKVEMGNVGRHYYTWRYGG
ncbi:MAG: glycoside hydrolase family 99-like domain-containing protein [Chloroflexi bacterium]|nr:glycoside hydrolase family 99-like domain-containing protein [Chloroflexota bacterium]